MRTKRKRKRRINPWPIIFIVIVAILIIFIFKACSSDPSEQEPLVYGPEVAFGPKYISGPLSAVDKIEIFSITHDVSLSDYPQSLIDLLERKPETEEFVLNYPLLKDSNTEVDISEHENSSSVPLFIQWDQRWGYKQYGDDIMALTGCGPTCLSMVAVHLLEDTRYDPAYIADFSIENGYCVAGSGTSWVLMSEGASELGLDVTVIPLVEQRIIDNLEVGNPIICVVGPGEFTTTGHFIVLTGYEDGKLVVNDPNSKENSEKLWEFEDIQDEIENLWVYRVI